MDFRHHSKQAILIELKLVEAAKQDPSRFGPLYERYYKPIFLFVFKRCGSEEISADICSQVFLKALVNLPRYKFKGVPFSAWLYRIASNEVSQYFRDKAGQRVVSLDQGGLERMQGFLDEVEGSGITENLRQALIDVLEILAEEDLLAIEMRFFENRSFKEVAYILGITENNAKVRVFRVLKKMKKALLERQAKP